MALTRGSVDCAEATLATYVYAGMCSKTDFCCLHVPTVRSDNESGETIRPDCTGVCATSNQVTHFLSITSSCSLQQWQGELIRRRMSPIGSLCYRKVWSRWCSSSGARMQMKEQYS